MNIASDTGDEPMTIDTLLNNLEEVSDEDLHNHLLDLRKERRARPEQRKTSEKKERAPREPKPVSKITVDFGDDLELF